MNYKCFCTFSCLFFSFLFAQDLIQDAQLAEDYLYDRRRQPPIPGSYWQYFNDGNNGNGWGGALILEGYLLNYYASQDVKHLDRMREYRDWLKGASLWKDKLTQVGTGKGLLNNWSDDAAWIAGCFIHFYKLQIDTDYEEDLEMAYDILVNSDKEWCLGVANNGVKL